MKKHKQGKSYNGKLSKAFLRKQGKRRLEKLMNTPLYIKRARQVLASEIVTTGEEKNESISS